MARSYRSYDLPQAEWGCSALGEAVAACSVKDWREHRDAPDETPIPEFAGYHRIAQPGLPLILIRPLPKSSNSIAKCGELD